jgi:hypothetical protein
MVSDRRRCPTTGPWTLAHMSIARSMPTAEKPFWKSTTLALLPRIFMKSECMRRTGATVPFGRAPASE